MWRFFTRAFSIEKDQFQSPGAANLLPLGWFRSLVSAVRAQLAKAAPLQAEDHFRSIVEQSTDTIFLTDENGVFIEFNAAAEKATGIPRDHALGMTAWDFQCLLLPEERQNQVESRRIKGVFQKALQTGQSPLFSRIVEADFRRADGQRRSVAQKIFPIPTQKGYRIGGISHDITEHRQTVNLLRLQHDLNATLSVTSDLGDALEKVLEALCRVECIDCGAIYRLDKDSGGFNLVLQRNLSPEFTALISHYAPGEPLSQLIRTGQPVYGAPKIADAPSFLQMKREGLLTLALLPVLFEGQPLAGITLASHTAEEIPENTRIVIEAIATGIGGMLARIQMEEALKESQRDLQTLFDTLDDLLIIVGSDGRILQTNPAARQKLGYSSAELSQMTIHQVHPPQQWETVTHVFNEILAGRENICTVPLLTKDGRLIPAETRVSQGRWGSQKATFGITRDITERKKVEDALLESEQKLRAIIEQNSEGILLIDESGIISEWNQASEQITGLTREEAMGKSYLDLQFMLVTDEHRTPERKQYLKETLDRALKTGQSPLFYRTLEATIQRRDGRRVPVHQTIFPMKTSTGYRIGSVTRDITEQKRSQQQIQALNADLLEAYDATIEGWARALELRDHETEGHSRRVLTLTLELARRLGICEADLVHIRRGAILHDIGKMGIPDQILLKPGPLTNEEWTIMRQHPTYAYQMLASIPFLQNALEIPYCHHELWDGSGYPRGLKGGEIPFAARIFTVVDVWDALLNDRAYRPAWPIERARQYLANGAGVYFDPQIVAAFLHMIEELAVDCVSPAASAHLPELHQDAANQQDQEDHRPERT